MKTNIKVTALGISGVLLLGGFFSQFEVPKATLVLENHVLYKGMLIPNTLKAKEIASKVHSECFRLYMVTTQAERDKCKRERLQEVYSEVPSR